MSFTSEDVADNDIPPHPYFTVEHYVERVRALTLALLLVGAVIAYADPTFAPAVGRRVVAMSQGVIASFDSVTRAYHTALASYAL
jgi:predicted NAD-dependent protein-ADP-ribosyltransferase YbiA (DUF1768 family)